MIFDTEVCDVRLVVRFHQQVIPYRLLNLGRKPPPSSEKVVKQTTLVKI